MRDANPTPPVTLDPETPLSTHDVWAVACARAPVEVSARAHEAVSRARATLDALVAEGRMIYGVTTGFGPLATTRVSPDHARQLQRNLIYHLASGVGPPLSRAQTRAVMIARLSSLIRGYSGARPEVISLLVALLNHDLIPVVPSLGTVGASGDLTPLAHVALAMMGEGEVWGEQGQPVPSAQALREAGLEPLRLEHKEGLALVNGTAAMTGLAARSSERVARLSAASALLSAVALEVLDGRADAWDALLGRARPHPGQRVAHALLAEALGDPSARAQTPARLDPEALDGDGVLPTTLNIQDPYTLRCAPQVLGAALDAWAFHRRVVEVELRAATDNPLLDVAQHRVVHGGNFYGQHVSAASDLLAATIIKLALWSERRLARLTDASLSAGLPPFLQPRQPGLQSGLMGAQVTATALVAHMRERAVMTSAQSIPTNANNQDIVSLGSLAALKAEGLLDDAEHILAIEALALAQAVRLRRDLDGRAPSPSALRLLDRVAPHSPPLGDDRPLSPDIRALAARWSTPDWAPSPRTRALLDRLSAPLPDPLADLLDEGHDPR